MSEEQPQNYQKLLFDRAASLTRTHGILSIIFGGLGALIGLIILIFFGFAFGFSETSEDVAYSIIMLVATFVFFVLPHVYMIIAGVSLTRHPQPSTAKLLIIFNLIIGFFWNLVIFILAIINLTQLHDYEQGYHAGHHKK